MVLWQQYGITSFNFAESRCEIPFSYWLLKNALEYSSPSLVVMDIRRADRQEIIALDGYSTVFDEFPLSLVKIEAALDLLPTWDQRLELILPLFRFHGRWKELNRFDFYHEPSRERIDMGGSAYNNAHLSVAVPADFELLPVSEKHSPEKASEEYLRRIIELCQEKNIDVLLVELPYPADAESQKYANGITDLAAEYGIDYLNMHQIPGIVDFTVDMNDADSHLNDSGAYKLTCFIGQYLRNRYQIPSHRYDNQYKWWHQRYTWYLSHRNRRISQQNSLENFLMLSSHGSIGSLIYIPAQAAEKMDERMRRILMNLSEDTTAIDLSGIKGEDLLLITGWQKQVLYCGKPDHVPSDLSDEIWESLKLFPGQGSIRIRISSEQSKQTQTFELTPKQEDEICCLTKIWHYGQVYPSVFCFSHGAFSRFSGHDL
ncbi:MAG: hypothetical protein IKE58_11220 [Blautia sp.]|nr:hypothetical protein [Blautia sp.]